ncbi:hypothetical protein SHIRM173S_09471 [Streptomyces hirsutus]
MPSSTRFRRDRSGKRRRTGPGLRHHAGPGAEERALSGDVERALKDVRTGGTPRHRARVRARPPAVTIEAATRAGEEAPREGRKKARR